MYVTIYCNALVQLIYSAYTHHYSSSIVFDNHPQKQKQNKTNKQTTTNKQKTQKQQQQQKNQQKLERF